ncbi:MAG: hypothetical protein ACI9KS_001192 [Sulfitobacter sp.]
MASHPEPQWRKDDFASDRQSFVSTPSPSSTLRDVQLIVAHLRQPQVIVVLCIVWLSATIAGPFNTLSELALPTRALYWGLVVFVTYAVGAFATQMFSRRVSKRISSAPFGLLVTAFLISLCIFTVLAVINAIFVPSWTSDPLQAVTAYVVVLLVCVAVLVLRHSTLGGVMIPEPKQAMILERLPLDKRGALISLSVQDHYVDIVTANGREMVLMRLSDAMREASDVVGMQIHRSHWVSLSQITTVQRAGDAARVTLSNGAELPVSRGYLPAVRAAGLLPKTGKPTQSG